MDYNPINKHKETIDRKNKPLSKKVFFILADFNKRCTFAPNFSKTKTIDNQKICCFLINHLDL